MEPETEKHFQLTSAFNADDAFAVLYEAGVFDSLYKHDVNLAKMNIDKAQEMMKKGVVVEEGIKRLSEVYTDTGHLIEVFKRYNIGTHENQLIRLSDVRDKKVVNKARADLKKHAETNPDRKVLFFFGFAGHGMQVDGE